MKLHPLDNGIANFRKQATRIAKRLKLGRRVLVMDGGHLPTLLSQSEGVVVVNSTTGLSALHHGRPVTVLGSAIFDIPGLTYRDRSTASGAEPPPDQELFKAFRKVVLARAQVNGSFFTENGITLAVEAALDRIDVPTVQPQPSYVLRPGRFPPALAPAESPALIRR